MNNGLSRQCGFAMVLIAWSALKPAWADNGQGLFTIGRIVESRVPYREGATRPLQVDMAVGGQVALKTIGQGSGMTARELGGVVASPLPADAGQTVPVAGLRSGSGQSGQMDAIGSVLTSMTRGHSSGLQATLQRSTAGIASQVSAPILQSIPGASRP